MQLCITYVHYRVIHQAWNDNKLRRSSPIRTICHITICLCFCWWFSFVAREYIMHNIDAFRLVTFERYVYTAWACSSKLSKSPFIFKYVLNKVSTIILLYSPYLDYALFSIYLRQEYEVIEMCVHLYVCAYRMCVLTY